MQSKNTWTEKNIEKLLNASFNKVHQPDRELENDMLQFLEQKVAQNAKELLPKNKITIGLSAVWMTFLIIFLSEGRISMHMFDLLKPALGLSLFFIPISCIVLIILNKSSYEKKVV